MSQSELKYRIVPVSVAICPEKEPLYSELNTFVEIEDESGGPFLVIRQSTDTSGTQIVRMNAEEWPLWKEAIEQMMKSCEKLNW